MTAHFKTPAIRSRKYLGGARGQPCQLRFVGVCLDPKGLGHETTVACHIHSSTFGMAHKADDISVCDGCRACHAYLDFGWVGKISRIVLMEHILRGLQETLRNRISRGLLVLDQDSVKKAEPKPRKPREKRQKVAARKNPLPPKGSRKIGAKQ